MSNTKPVAVNTSSPNGSTVAKKKARKPSEYDALRAKLREYRDRDLWEGRLGGRGATKHSFKDAIARIEQMLADGKEDELKAEVAAERAKHPTKKVERPADAPSYRELQKKLKQYREDKLYVGRIGGAGMTYDEIGRRIAEIEGNEEEIVEPPTATVSTDRMGKLVAVKRITTAITFDLSEWQIKALAQSFLKVGNHIPLILEQVSNDEDPEYVLVDPSYKQQAILAAARAAREIDPKAAEMIHANVAIDQEKAAAIAWQLDWLK